MTHLPYIVPAYALTVLVLVGFGAGSWWRMRQAARRLLAIDPRGSR